MSEEPALFTTLVEALRDVLASSRGERGPWEPYPALVVHRDIEGQHDDSDECWCCPLRLGEADGWLDWTAEELAERVRGKEQ